MGDNTLNLILKARLVKSTPAVKGKVQNKHNSTNGWFHVFNSNKRQTRKAFMAFKNKFQECISLFCSSSENKKKINPYSPWN